MGILGGAFEGGSGGSRGLMPFGSRLCPLGAVGSRRGAAGFPDSFFQSQPGPTGEGNLVGHAGMPCDLPRKGALLAALVNLVTGSIC